jgi:hypothetical protein
MRIIKPAIAATAALLAVAACEQRSSYRGSAPGTGWFLEHDLHPDRVRSA